MFLKKYAQLPNKFFALLFWNIFAIYLLIFICLGLLALFGVKPIEFNGEPTYGVLGLVVALLMAPFIALATALTSWILVITGNLIIRLGIAIIEK